MMLQGKNLDHANDYGWVLKDISGLWTLAKSVTIHDPFFFLGGL